MTKQEALRGVEKLGFSARKGKELHFGDVLDAADKLTMVEQESLVEVLHRRILERRREVLANDIREAGQEYEAGGCRPSTPDEILDEILS